MHNGFNNKLILGTAQMGLAYGINNNLGKISSKESINILKYAFDKGIRTLDSAEVYGNAHQVIGLFHKTYQNSKFNIITKFTHNIKKNLIKDKLSNYLHVLSVKSIEVLMFHSFESFQKNKDSLNTLAKMKLNGLINHIGVSVYSNDQIKSLINEDLITVVQLPFNMLDNLLVKGELLNNLKKKGKIVHTRSTFLQGLFFKDLNENSKILDSLSEELETLNQLVIESDCLMEELALSYCIVQNNIDNVIIGVDSIEQLDLNIKASSYSISKKSLNRINEIRVKDLDLLNPTLWE